MRPRTSLAVGAIAAALTFALAGCFSGAPSAPTSAESAPPAISVDPATGELIEGTGYTVNAPEGWAVPPDAPPSADVYVIGEEANAAGFVDNFNVMLGPDPGDTPAEIETKGVAYLEDVVGATEVEVRPRVTIAGSETAHISAQLSRQGIAYWTEQYLLADSGLVYTITFSFGETVPQGDREALADSVLATWTWAAPTADAEGYYEDPVGGFAITFPGEPMVEPRTGSDEMRAFYSTTPDPNQPDAIVYIAGGTAASPRPISPGGLQEILMLMGEGQDYIVSEAFEFNGMSALTADFTDPTGKPSTMLVAGEANRYYQLVVFGGTSEERQAFFDSFTLLG